MDTIIRTTLIVIISIIVIKDIMMIVGIIQEIKGIILKVDTHENIGSIRYQDLNLDRMKEGIRVIQRVMTRKKKVMIKIWLDNSISYIYNIFDIYIM